MSKFNTATARSRAGVNQLTTESTPSGQTFEGASGYAHDQKTELFLAAVSDFGGEGAFYEKASDRTNRINKLTHEVAVVDAQWIKDFTNWLRYEANLRTISLTVAMEAAKALLKAGIPGARQIVAGSIRRADEPGEALAYWMATEGRKTPSAVKRGIADAVVATYSEYTLAKYDTASHGFRFGDVIELTHPSPKDDKQSELFKFALDRRKNGSSEPSSALTMLANRAKFLGLTKEEQVKTVTSDNGSEVLKDAGLTWEVVGSTAGLNGQMWESLIPSMGYMALLRNLRNFAQNGVSEKGLDAALKRLTDPEAVAKSRQLPFRFLSAYRANRDNLKFAYPLETALNHSLANVPSLKGKTLIMVDMSRSMTWHKSKHTDLTYADTAAIFGSALALRAENATLVQFGTGSQEVQFNKTDSVLSVIKRFRDMGGTATRQAITKHFDKSYDRVIVLTDDQNADGNAFGAVPATVPCYTWNFLGYRFAGSPGGANRVWLGGLSDKSFQLIPLLEQGRDAGWPWETK